MNNRKIHEEIRKEYANEITELVDVESKKVFTSWIVESNNQYIPTLELLTIPKLIPGNMLLNGMMNIDVICL